MIPTRFLNSIIGNNQFQSIFGSIDHNSMIVTSMKTRIFNSTMILEMINRPGRLSIATLVSSKELKSMKSIDLMKTVFTFGSMHFLGSKNLIEEDMCSRRNSLERTFLGSAGDIVMDFGCLRSEKSRREISTHVSVI